MEVTKKIVQAIKPSSRNPRKTPYHQNNQKETPRHPPIGLLKKIKVSPLNLRNVKVNKLSIVA